MTRSQTLASVFYRRFRGREQWRDWKKKKRAGEDEDAEAIGERFHLYIQVVRNEWKLIMVRGEKMVNPAESPAADSTTPDEPITLEQLVEVRRAELKEADAADPDEKQG